MRIGELAESAGVGTKTVRFYEARGLLPPPARTPSGYRDYDGQSVSRLRFIRAAQAAGFTLREIAGILAVHDDGEPPCRHVQALIDHHRDQVDERIAELERARQELDALAGRARGVTPDDCPPSSICRIIAT